MKPLIWLLVCLITAAAAQADDSGLLEDRTPLRIETGHRTFALESFVARPNQGTRFPVAVILHGAAPSDGEVRGLDLTYERQWARILASRGWLAVSVARRGYAGSEGPPFLAVGTCKEPAAAAYLDHHADEIAAVLRTIAKRADADMTRVLLVGKSVGGAVALDVASRTKLGIKAVVNISGGLGHGPSRLTVNPDCSLFPADVVWNFARFGATSRMPTLWLYAENDPFFSPAFVARLHTAYTAAGGNAELAMLPAFAPDGHQLFETVAGQQQILPMLDRFLRVAGLPTWDPDFLTRLLTLLKSGQRDAGLEYVLNAPAHKALAVGDGDSTVAWWGSNPDSVGAAKSVALHHCEDHAHQSCHLIAVNFNLMTTAVAAAP